MWVRPPGWEDPLEEGMATHSSICLVPPSLFAWNYHKIVNRLYPNTKYFWCLKKNKHKIEKKKKLITWGLSEELENYSISKHRILEEERAGRDVYFFVNDDSQCP